MKYAHRYWLISVTTAILCSNKRIKALKTIKVASLCLLKYFAFIHESLQNLFSQRMCSSQWCAAIKKILGIINCLTLTHKRCDKSVVHDIFCDKDHVHGGKPSLL